MSDTRNAAALAKLWRHSSGKAWEPKGGVSHPSALKLIDGGWVKICTMRCGFEAFDTGLNWTDAARAYFAASGIEPTPSQPPEPSTGMEK